MAVWQQPIPEQGFRDILPPKHMDTHPVWYIARGLFPLVLPMYASARHPTTVNLLAVLEKVYDELLDKSQCHSSQSAFTADAAS